MFYCHLCSFWSHKESCFWQAIKARLLGVFCSFSSNPLMHWFSDLSPNIKLQLTPYMIIFVRTTSTQTAANPLQLMVSVRMEAREMMPSFTIWNNLHISNGPPLSWNTSVMYQIFIKSTSLSPNLWMRFHLANAFFSYTPRHCGGSLGWIFTLLLTGRQPHG